MSESEMMWNFKKQFAIVSSSSGGSQYITTTTGDYGHEQGGMSTEVADGINGNSSLTSDNLSDLNTAGADESFISTSSLKRKKNFLKKR